MARETREDAIGLTAARLDTPGLGVRIGNHARAARDGQIALMRFPPRIFSHAKHMLSASIESHSGFGGFGFGSFRISGLTQCGILSLPVILRPGKLRSRRESDESSPSPKPNPAVVLPVAPPRSKPDRSTGCLVCSTELPLRILRDLIGVAGIMIAIFAVVETVPDDPGNLLCRFREMRLTSWPFGQVNPSRSLSQQFDQRCR